MKEKCYLNNIQCVLRMHLIAHIYRLQRATCHIQIHEDGDDAQQSRHSMRSSSLALITLRNDQCGCLHYLQ